MPVTAKLSRKFYEQFGDDLTNELVNWMNQVDATYRAEFRDLFEVHFARFDAKLEQRLAEVRSELREELGVQRSDLLHAMAEMKADLRTEIAASRAETIRWNFLFWIGTLGTVVALVKL